MAYGQVNVIARVSWAAALALVGAACSGAEPFAPTTGIAGIGGGASPGFDAGRPPLPGREACADPAWACWPMPNPRSAGLPNAASYDTSIPGAVVDQLTDLMWQRDVSGGSTFTWTAAKDYCDALTFNTLRDWRLPTRIELVGLTDFTRGSAGIDTDFFSPAGASFWTSTPALGGSAPPARAWLVSFAAGGATTIDSETFNAQVRCVRARSVVGQPMSRYRIEGTSPDDTVVDLGTGLVWQRTLAGATLTFDDAHDHCAAVTLPGTGWRVPSVKELQTLVHDGKTQAPFIDGEAFPGTPAGLAPFWTSSPSVTVETAAWFVNFGTGEASDVAPVAGDGMDQLNHVRCVR
jgi:hypothetical protein